MEHYLNATNTIAAGDTHIIPPSTAQTYRAGAESSSLAVAGMMLNYSLRLHVTPFEVQGQRRICWHAIHKADSRRPRYHVVGSCHGILS